MNDRDRIINSLRNSIWGFFHAITIIVFPFMNRTIILYVLGEKYLGLSSLFYSIFSVFNLAEAGFGTAIVYFMYKPVAENNHKEISAILQFYQKVYRWIGILIATIALLIMPLIPNMSKNGYPVEINVYILYILYLVNALIPYFTFEYKVSLFVVNQRIDYKWKYFTATSFAMYIFQALSLILWKNYYIYMILFVSQTVVYYCLVENKTKKIYLEDQPEGRLCVEKQKEIFRKVSALIGNQIDKTFLESSDNIILSFFMGLNVVGIYGNYMYICNAVLIILESFFFQALSGSVGNSVAVENHENNYEKFKNTLYLNNIITGFCSASIFTLMQHFMSVWAGRAMLLPMFTQILFSTYFYLLSLRKNIALFKNAAGMWSEDKFRPYVSIVVNIGLDIILVPFMGINGALIATIVSVCAIELPWEVYVLHRFYFKTNVYHYYIIVLKGVVANVLFALVQNKIAMIFISEITLSTLFIKAILCLLCGIIYYSMINFKNIRYIVTKK